MLQQKRVWCDAECQAGFRTEEIDTLDADLTIDVMQMCYDAAGTDRHKVIVGSCVSDRHRRTGPQAGRQTGRQARTDGQPDGWTDRQTDLQVCKPKRQLLLGPIGFKGDEATGGSSSVPPGRNHLVHHPPC